MSFTWFIIHFPVIPVILLLAMLCGNERLEIFFTFVSESSSNQYIFLSLHFLEIVASTWNTRLLQCCYGSLWDNWFVWISWTLLSNNIKKSIFRQVVAIACEIRWILICWTCYFWSIKIWWKISLIPACISGMKLSLEMFLICRKSAIYHLCDHQ